MPIRKSERSRYPANWAEISAAIKDRAGWHCECEGECGSVAHSAWSVTHGRKRCPNRHGQPSEFTGAKVVLTTAHLDHVPEHATPENLRSWCSLCHLNYDRAHHAETRAATLAAKKG